jgi:hypothetical protein
MVEEPRGMSPIVPEGTAGGHRQGDARGGGDPMFVDTKLARGLTMAEARAILRAPPNPASAPMESDTHPVRTAFKPVGWRYRTGRLPDPEYLDAFRRNVDGIFERDPGTIARQPEPVPGGEPGRAFAVQYLSLVPESQGEACRDLIGSCTSLFADGRNASLCRVRVFEVSLHVIERFHQRTRGGLVRYAFRAFGAEALANIGMATMMMTLVGGRDGHVLAMPFADGLVLGEAVPRPAAVSARHIILQPLGLKSVVLSRKPVASVGDRSRAGPDSEGMVCRFRTFVGPDEMFDRQLRVRDALRAIARDHAEDLAGFGLQLTAPSLAHRQDKHFGRSSHRLLNSPMVPRIAELLRDPEVIRTLTRKPDVPRRIRVPKPAGWVAGMAWEATAPASTSGGPSTGEPPAAPRPPWTPEGAGSGVPVPYRRRGPRKAGSGGIGA